ncbi:NAD(P)-dependent oxidoreductase [Planococcus salinus]|uniref:NAD(P)-dependent oxidoreductase n=1 Tax=Planococcus salinus TaxID=1848460 RepID=A0A3M8P7V8_9BACL|nr:NAD(P)-dependent oxidoreductase [Planococcus salinus]RNF39779.1 NAD(P)-dependent oxidoreductase [Planococcus salinus]
MKDKTIGFIGLGNMGHHMVTRLLERGYKLALYDINTEVLKSFEGEGVQIASSPRDVGDKAECVLVSLPTPAIVKGVALSSDGVIEGKKVEIFVDLSTTGKEMAETIAAGLSEKGIKVLDSPVSGGVSGAKNGTLATMVSGDKETYESCHEVLEIIGKNIFYIGEEPGQAQSMKIINNLLSFASLAMTSEAVVLGVKAGLDPDKMIQVLDISSGRNTATRDKFPRSILSRKFDFGFKTSLAYKDIKMYGDLAAHLNVPIFLGSNLIHFWRFAMTQGAGDKDFTYIVRYMEEWAGVEIK